MAWRISGAAPAAARIDSSNIYQAGVTTTTVVGSRELARNRVISV